MRAFLLSMLVLAVSCALDISLGRAAHADDEEGAWVRGAVTYPLGTTRRAKNGRDQYRMSRGRLVNEALVSSESRPGHYVFTTTWSAPPNTLKPGQTFSVRGAIKTRVLRKGVGSGSGLDVWSEGAGARKPKKPKRIWASTDHGPLSPSHVWKLRAPAQGRAGRAFKVVVRPLMSWGGKDLIAVYTYEWKVAEPVAAVEVTARLEDEDDQFTPCDQATLILSVRNLSNREALAPVEVEARWIGDVGTRRSNRLSGIEPHIPAIRFNDHLWQPTHGQERTRRIAPGATHEIRLQVISAGEEHAFIRKQLLLPGAGHETRRKPRAERSYKLDKSLEVKVRTTGRSAKTILERVVPIKQGKRTARLQYPDLRRAAGNPPDVRARFYYRTGDPSRSPAGQTAVRGLALRAARYLEPSRDGRQALIPEKDVARVVENVANWVHAALMPKRYPEPILSIGQIASELYRREYGPSEPRPADDKTGFACVEHAFLFNTLLRALGIAAREVNALAYSPIPVPLLTVFQDAASQVWHDGQWHFWSLWFHKPSQDPIERYARWGATFELWAGTRPYTGADVRFSMSSRAMEASDGVWRFIGYGSRDLTGGGRGRFTETDTPPGTSWYLPQVVFRFHSPVVASVTLDDGTTVGPRRALPISRALNDWYVLGGPPPPGADGLVGGGGHWFPEGLTTYTDWSDPSTKQVWPQTLTVTTRRRPAEVAKSLKVRATGAGPWRLEVFHVEEAGLQRFGDITGRVEPGDTVSIPTGLLRAQGARERLPTRTVSKRPGKRTSVSPRQRWLRSPEPAKFEAWFTEGQTHRLTTMAAGPKSWLAVATRTSAEQAPVLLVDASWTSLFSKVKQYRDAGYAVTALAARGSAWIVGLARDRSLGVQKIRRAKDHTELDEEMRTYLARGYGLTALAHRAGSGWTLVFSAKPPDGAQEYVITRTGSELVSWMRGGWAEGAFITHAAHDGTRYLGVMSSGGRIVDQRWVKRTKADDIKREVREAWDDGYHVTGANWVDGGYLIVFSKIEHETR